MPDWGLIAIAAAALSALVWVVQVIRRRSQWELIAWLPGVALMLTGAFAIGLYQGNVAIIHEVGEILELRKTITIDNAPDRNITVVDGDTLQINDVSFRLEDIDAFEPRQCCLDAAGKNIDCSEVARGFLGSLIRDKSVTCTWLKTDTFGRPLATCSADGVNLNAAMVAAGQAIVFHYKDRRKGKHGEFRFKSTFLAQQQLAASQKIGLHAYKQYDPPHLARQNRKSDICPQS